MARPLRNLYPKTLHIRRRHRTWMGAMICASLAWGVWWVALALSHWMPEWLPSLKLLGVLSSLPALVGLLLAIVTIRARDIWIALASIPITANGAVLTLPWLFDRELAMLFSAAT